MTTLIRAPFTGWVRRLDEVPDPVFAEGMVGDGLALDPLEGRLDAPCAGTVVSLAPTAHALTLRTADGIELLLHIGIDTVELAGRGFTALVQAGAEVGEGDPLIAFDLDHLAQAATSPITPIIVTSPSAKLTRLAPNGAIDRGAPLFEVTDAGEAPEVREGTAPPASAGAALSRTVRLVWPHGIHARPAARIVRLCRTFAAEVQLEVGDRRANGASLTSLLALGAGLGDTVRIFAQGGEAGAVLAALAAMLEQQQAEDAHPEVAPALAPPRSPDRLAPGQIAGVRAAPGIGAGPVFAMTRNDRTIAEQGAGPAAETAALNEAVRIVAATTEQRAATASDAAKAIALAHRDLLFDVELHHAASQAIASGRSAAFAWRASCRAQQALLGASGSPRLAERAADLRDVERQVLDALAGDRAAAAALPPGRSIVTADELLPSQFLGLDPSRVAGICTARGGPTSHVAILAASLGIPMLVAAGDEVCGLAPGRMVVLDADAGILETAPADDRLAEVAARIEQRATDAAAARRAAQTDCQLADGTRIEVFANLASIADARAAVEAGAEGCGLLRTEFLFLDRPSAPDEAEQRATYAAIAEALGGRPLIVRTLDIGGDKPVSYLPFAHEDNPALGARGIRFSLARRDLLEIQLRAILRGVPAGQCRIMLPMVIEVAELADVRAMLDRIAAGLGLTARVPLGVMVETPAAAILADGLAAQADFLSVGSNDLAQYTLAIDRGNPRLADRADALHPAVLRLIAQAAEGAARFGRWFGICGGLASDPDAAPLLVGLGVTELSVTPAAVPAIKARLRGVGLDQCRALAQTALAADSAVQVRQIVRSEQA